MKKYTKWTKEEIEILNKSYKNYDNLFVQTLIPNRTISAITTKAQELKIIKEPETLRSIQRKFKINQDYFAEINSHRKAYWLGWIWGDGSLSRVKNSLTISVHYNDRYILENFKSDIESEHLIKRTGNMSYIRVSSFKLKEDLQNLNIFPNKSYRQDLPKVPLEFVNSFILGLFEADGYVGITSDSKNKNWKSIRIEICGTKTTCSWIKTYLDYLYSVDFGKIYDCSDNKIAQRFSLGGKEKILKFYNLIYRDIKENILERKLKIFESYYE